MNGHGGRREGSGRKVARIKTVKAPAKAPAIDGWMEPLDYMMAVMNDPEADALRRDRMAVQAAPYRHARIEERVGKKEQRQEAAARASEKFAVPAAPKLVVNNK